MIRKIVSGGQTGADRAGLDAALELGIPIGGYVPLGRWAEDGPIAYSYTGLIETGSADPAIRTRLNVQSSDATAVFTHGRAKGGSALTIKIARELERPCLPLDLAIVSLDSAAERLRLWLLNGRFEVLNVAGSRGSIDPELYGKVRDILLAALKC